MCLVVSPHCPQLAEGIYVGVDVFLRTLTRSQINSLEKALTMVFGGWGKGGRRMRGCLCGLNIDLIGNRFSFIPNNLCTGCRLCSFWRPYFFSSQLTNSLCSARFPAIHDGQCVTISTAEVGIIEKFGKYSRNAQPGCNFYCAPMEQLVGRLSFR